MILADLKASLTADAPPGGLEPALAALWHAGRGEWDLAHKLAQAENNETANTSWGGLIFTESARTGLRVARDRQRFYIMLDMKGAKGSFVNARESQGRGPRPAGQPAAPACWTSAK